MKLTRLIAIIAIGLTAVHAEPLTFDFKDPMGVNNVVFKLDAPLESINGTASGVSGTVTIDPANPGEAKGKIVVATDSLTVPNPLMKEHLVGEKWLNAKAHPEITFEIKSISNIEKKDTKGEAKVTGTFTRAFMARMVAARSVADRSPRSRTSLPTTTARTVSG